MAKKPGTAVTKWDERMAAKAAKQQETKAPTGGGISIRTRGGVLAIGEEAIKGGKLDCIILGRLYENAFYEGDFDPDAPKPPVCYAFNAPDWTGDQIGSLMTPHGEAPKKQADKCADCPQNRYGSADKGRGKACKNVVRLALMMPDALKKAELVSSEQFARMSIPVTSVQNYHKYEELLTGTVKYPTFGVITRISLAPHPKFQYQVQFELVKKIDANDKIGDALEARADAVLKELAQPYPVGEDEDEKPKRGVKSKVVAKNVPAKGKSKLRK